MTQKVIVLGVTGASGAPYLIRLLRLLLEADTQVHLAVTDLGKRLLFEELEIHDFSAKGLGVPEFDHQLVVYKDRNLGAKIASGSFVHDGMIVLPCSSNTLGAIASGVTNTLVQRAAAVTLKEGRRLVLAHRESPLSLIDLRNMCTVTEAGGIVTPLSPGFYMLPKTIDDLIEFMVCKLADLVGIDHELPLRWDPAVR